MDDESGMEDENGMEKRMNGTLWWPGLAGLRAEHNCYEKKISIWLRTKPLVELQTSLHAICSSLYIMKPTGFYGIVTMRW